MIHSVQKKSISILLKDEMNEVRKNVISVT